MYPIQAPYLLFSDTSTTSPSKDTSNPFSYLLISLLLVDIRSSVPILLEQLNSPTYTSLSTRLTSAFDIISHFISHLVRALDSPSPSSTSLSLSPSDILSLRKNVSETMSNTISYLRDRYDASVAGAMGLHPSARTAPTHTGGDRLTVAWDSATDRIENDGLILSAVRALALWLREDDNDQLRREAAGLADLFVDLYSASMKRGHEERGGLDFRQPVLVAFEGITACEEEGVEALLEHEGWKVLAEDMLGILSASSKETNEEEAGRGIEIVRVLLPIVEAESPGAREEWMDVVTRVAAWHVPDQRQEGRVEEFQVAVCQLVTALLVNNHPGVVRRYRHSIGAVVGVVRQLRERGKRDAALREELDDVLVTLEELAM